MTRPRFVPPKLSGDYVRDVSALLAALRDLDAMSRRPAPAPAFDVSAMPEPGALTLCVVTDGDPAVNPPRLAFAWRGSWYYADDSTAV